MFHIEFVSYLACHLRVGWPMADRKGCMEIVLFSKKEVVSHMTFCTWLTGRYCLPVTTSSFFWTQSLPKKRTKQTNSLRYIIKQLIFKPFQNLKGIFSLLLAMTHSIGEHLGCDHVYRFWTALLVYNHLVWCVYIVCGIKFKPLMRMVLLDHHSCIQNLLIIIYWLLIETPLVTEF